jgi:hypothetical protein
LLIDDSINNNTNNNITLKAKKKYNKIEKEKERSDNKDDIEFLNKKRNRFALKRGTNCSWTVEEVYKL